MGNHPEVSIIIPTYNEAKTIGKVIGHLNPWQDKIEIILVDGGSTDGTTDLICRNVKVILAPKGRAIQMNAGAQAASGEILLFLHSDTRLPDNFMLQLKIAMSDGNITGGAFRVKFDQPGLFFSLASIGSNLRAAITGIYFGDQAIFARREAFLKVGGYPPIKLMEDWELSRKLREVGKTILLPGPVITSARRWLIYGKWRTTYLLHRIKILYLLGVSPEKLKRMYTNRRQ